ncbi:MAG: threonine/serine dehydratase [Candidatus Sericytochromatia bacterium]|nr:threonine/serine dehydratase [Candidatus Tanganyikabacteria bacterium]
MPDFSLDAFRAAADLVWPHIRRTPLLRGAALSEATGCDVWLKCETFQVTHSFKDRAAFGALLPRLAEARERGIATSSSGNFAQAAAYAGRKLGVAVTVVMMESARPNKVAATRAHGAEIAFCPPDFAPREAALDRLLAETGRLKVHPYDDEFTVRGNGTLGFELLEEAPDAAAVVIPVGGGGLIAGAAAVLKQGDFGGRIYGVQPELNPAFRSALAAGELIPQPFARSIADGLLATAPGATGFALARQYVDGALEASEAEIASATLQLFEDEKVLVEPSGAVAVAALIRDLARGYRGQKVVCVLSGANLDLAGLAEVAATWRRLPTPDALARS